MREYEVQATKFLTKHGLVFRAAWKGDRCPPWDDKEHIHGDRYRITIKREGYKGRRCSLSFDFWNSLRDSQEGKEPTAYSVLACISGDYHVPDTLEEFCSDYGFDADSRKAEQTFRRVSSFAQKMRAFFTEAEAAELVEIN